MKNIKTIEIVVAGEAWENALNKAFKKKNKDLKVEGFRKGKTPKDIYLKKFGIESLYMDAIDIAMPDAFKEALDKVGITPVIKPNGDVIRVNEKEVKYSFTFISKPDVTLGEYKKLGVKKEKAKVSKEEIAEEVKRLKDQLAEIMPKESGQVEVGDTAVIDFEGFVDGKPLEGGKGENFPLEIGSNTFIPGFEDGVVGMKINEEKELNLTFPEDYVEDLKGKKVKFKVKVNEIKQRIVPELNEDFYADLGFEDIKTEEEFLKEVENVLIDRKNVKIEDIFIEEVLSKASENLKVEINDEIIDEEVHQMIHQFEEQLKMQGLKIKDYMNMLGLTHEKLHEQMEPEATKRIKYRYLLEAIAEAEKIDFSEEEVKEKTEEMATNYGITVDELIAAYGSLDVIKYDMRMHKALEILKDNN